MTDLRKLAEAARDSAAHYVKFRSEENSRIADECGLRFRLEASPENILTLLDASAAKDAEIARLREEMADMNQTIIAFVGARAGIAAMETGLKPTELHPVHYDILKKAGARLDDFTRATIKEATHE